VLAIGIPLLDTFLAVWRRFVRHLLSSVPVAGSAATAENGRIMRADMDHLHHRLVRAGLSQTAAATWMYAAGIALVGMGMLSLVLRSYAFGLMLCTFVLGAYVVVKHLARVELLESGTAIVHGLRRPASRVLAVILYPPLDVVIMSFSLAVSLVLALPGLDPVQLKRIWVQAVPVWVGLPFFVLTVTRAYSRVWSRARVSEYVVLSAAVLGGILISIAMASMIGKLAPRAIVLVAVVHAGISLPALTGLRAFPRAVQDGLAWTRRRRPEDSGAVRNFLVYGAGYGCTLFLRARSFDLPDPGLVQNVVGILDDDLNLHGRLVYGYRVLGGIRQAEEIIRSRHVTDIVVTTALREDVITGLTEIADAEDVALSEWRTQVRPMRPARRVQETPDQPERPDQVIEKV
jgi:hypothetical protein